MALEFEHVAAPLTAMGAYKGLEKLGERTYNWYYKLPTYVSNDTVQITKAINEGLATIKNSIPPSAVSMPGLAALGAGLIVLKMGVEKFFASGARREI